MPEPRRSRLAALLLAALLAACARHAPPEAGTAPGPAEAARHRAALASVTVINETSRSVSIAFRSAAPPVREVLLGTVPPGRAVQLPPVPAREPIVLLARSAAGTTLELPVRSFEIDEEWTWRLAEPEP
jgi:hypothetical protein